MPDKNEPTNVLKLIADAKARQQRQPATPPAQPARPARWTWKNLLR